jgi:hypothetical protein
VILSPDMRREQVISDAIGLRQGIVLLTFSHFAC